MLLSAQQRGKATTTIYESTKGAQSRVRLEITNHTSGQRPLDVSVHVDKATIAFPQLCETGNPAATTLLTAFTLDDGVNLPVTVAGEAVWECLGQDPPQPQELRVQ